MAGKPHVLIAGAGVGGLTAALALLKRGFDVDIYEQAPEIMEVGAGFQISANGTRVLYELGLGPEIEAIRWEPEGKEIYVWNTGETKKLFDLGAESVEELKELCAHIPLHGLWQPGPENAPDDHATFVAREGAAQEPAKSVRRRVGAAKSQNTVSAPQATRGFRARP